MKVVVAMDSMKGSLSSLEAGNAVSEGIHRVFRDAEVTVCPLADGGEGTVEALTLGMNGTIEKVNVTGPLGSMIEASYGRIAESNTAIIEMSAAAGITLVNESDRNPLHTTTYGVGELIRDAIKKGCRKFIVGIGGSATNDGGIGMLEALGYGFLDADGKQVPYGANGLALIETITDEHVMPELKECKFRIACDVTNPLCGANGCSAVFGSQKGATQTMIPKMDTWLMNYAKKTKEKYSGANPNQAGTGAGCLSAPGRTVDCGFTCFPVEMHDGIIIVQQFTAGDMLQPQPAVRTFSRSAFALEEISLSIFLYDGSVH